MKLVNIIIVILKFLQFYGTKIIRNLFLLYNLCRIEGIKQTTIQFPICVEGKGKIVFSGKANIKTKNTIKVHKTSILTFKDNLRTGNNVTIVLAMKSSLTFEGSNLIEDNVSIQTNGDWKVGTGVGITKNCIISSREVGCYGNLYIGNNSHIGNNSIIDVSGNLTIGSDVAIGPNCIIYTHDHDYKSSPEIPWKGMPTIKPVVIENGAWIGSGVTILPGVKIGKNSIVAAGALVNKNVLPGSVVGGVPAKEIIKKK